MKWFIGFFVLLVALVTISGCTQPAQTTAPATTVPTPVPTTEQVIVTTEVPTTIATPVATTVPTTKVTTKAPTPTIQPAVTNVNANVTTVPTVTPASGITLIHITSTGFKPQVDIVLPGAGIAWVNDDSVPHAVKSTGKNDGMFTSDSLMPGSQFKYDFGSKEGIYEYALVDMPKINGTIVVKSGSTLWSTKS